MSITTIAWATHTFNPWSGCAKISAGCAHCYAAALPPRMRRGAAWAGASIEDQAAADARLPHLLAVPARVRFVSCEPLLGSVDLRGALLDWIIVGGESGHRARPMRPAWARGLRDQAGETGAAFFFKQWGEWAPSADIAAHGRTPPQAGDPDFFRRQGTPPDEVFRVGRARAGRLLDGQAHDALPPAALGGASW